MPDRSRHRRSKRSPQNKKKTGLIQPATVIRPPVPTQTQEPIIRQETPVVPVNVPIPTDKLPATSYPYITRELRTIAILAGIMLVILVVIAFISR
ncbi:MAG: hypothetical protein QGG15_04715 [Dehalococcoidales bacterium]|jgi:hypothetical protein|nr:hypothetical protein [Dehalococcoidales bacterium]MDP6738304.1 hypothetical protein [Dehalococcoidales bacterium]